VTAAQLAGLRVGTDDRPLARRWDGAWYVHIARFGYPPGLHIAGTRFSPWAFFPLYPLLVKGVHLAVGLGVTTAALATNAVLDVALAVALWHLAAEVADAATADRVTALFWLFPGSAVLSMAYSEPLFLLAAALGLLALLRRRWVLAGLAGMVATATRPDGLAVEAACVVALVLAARRGVRATAGALTAVVLCPLGLIGFLGYSDHRTGDALIWRRAEYLWQQRLDLNATLVRRLDRNLGHRTPHTVESAVLLLSIVLLVAGLGFVVRGRAGMPPELLAYLAVLLALSVGYGNVSAKPRFVLAMLPLFLGTARRLSTSATVVVASGLGLLLGAVAYFYVGLPHVAP
jgi:hypothetical protein